MSDLPNDGGAIPQPEPGADPPPADDVLDELDLGEELEPELEPEPGADPVEPPKPSLARGRPNGEVIREQTATIANLQREIAEIRAQQNAPRQPTQAEVMEQQRQERERFDLMSPYEQHLYTERKISEGVQRQTTQIAQQLWDQSDRREYEAILERNPAYRRLDDRVTELTRLAPGVPRRTLLATAIGLRALEQAPAARTRQTNNAATAAARQAATPSQAGSDVAGGRGRRGDSLEDRLRGVAI